MIPYDLLEVTWNEEVLMARPIGWNVDIESDSINPEEAEGVFVTKYELVCPNCGERCEFLFDSENIICDNCESQTSNPLREEIVDLNDEDMGNEDIENLIEEVNKIIDDSEKEDKNTSDQDIKSPEELFDDLEKSISNSEILLEPEEEDKIKVEETKKKTKKKTKKTKKKTNKKGSK